MNDEGLVGHVAILIGRSVGEHGVDDAQYLVRQRDDGLKVFTTSAQRDGTPDVSFIIRGADRLRA